MPKFTVFFKDKAINSAIFDEGVVHIGSDETNNLSVDSLAIAPAHAAVIIKESGSIIKQLNNDFPLIINNTKTKEAILQNNDQINIGKHFIVFSETESISPSVENTVQDTDVTQLNTKLQERNADPDANLQIMEGPHIGRILALKKTMTRIGNRESGVVIISKRKEGYYISALESHQSQKVNQQPLGDQSIRLNNYDIISLEDTSMQFFLS